MQPMDMAYGNNMSMNMPVYNNPNQIPQNNTPTYTTMQNVMYSPAVKPANPQSMIVGRFVNQINEVRPNEVPIDGTIGVFVINDLSHIYLKALNNNGTIDTLEFVPVPKGQDLPQSASVDSLIAAMNQRFDKIESMVRRNNRPRKYKKEGVDNGICE